MFTRTRPEACSAICPAPCPPVGNHRRCINVMVLSAVLLVVFSTADACPEKYMC
ncbi:hypothetical protein KCP78_11445 [Salmonella enterica subsp. enterica]|nr:hypothetical protein KCP78_11445 [Salmonella enterica subsp. enterica]